MNFRSLDYLKQSLKNKTQSFHHIGKLFKFITLVILIGFVIFEIMNSFDISIGQQIYIDKTPTATTVSLKTVHKIIGQLENIEASDFNKHISVIPCICKNSNLATTDQAIEQIFLKISPKYFKVMLDSSVLCYTGDYSKTKHVIEKFKQSFVNENFRIGKCTISSELVGQLKICLGLDENFQEPILDQIQLENLIKQHSDTLKVKTIYVSDWDEEIQYQTQRSEANNLFSPYEIIIQKGIPGQKRFHKALCTINGQIQQHLTVLKEEVIREPVTQIIKVVNRLNFMKPTHGVVTSRFGIRHKKPHRGLDIANIRGTKVYAAESGMVKLVSRKQNSYGNLIVIEHADNFSTYYAHLSKIRVKDGQKINKGQCIGEIGNTGRSRGDHLHFEVRKDGHPLDPEKLVI